MMQFLELKLPSKNDILHWADVFAHPTLEELTIWGEIFETPRLAQNISNRHIYGSKVKRLDLGVVRLPEEVGSSKSLELIVGGCLYLEHLRVYVESGSGLEFGMLIRILSSFREAYK
jgi:hypothetical protein